MPSAPAKELPEECWHLRPLKSMACRFWSSVYVHGYYGPRGLRTLGGMQDDAEARKTMAERRSG